MDVALGTDRLVAPPVQVRTALCRQILSEFTDFVSSGFQQIAGPEPLLEWALRQRATDIEKC